MARSTSRASASVLPTGMPQSPPPVQFAVRPGEYKIVIREMKGKAEGEATLKVT